MESGFAQAPDRLPSGAAQQCRAFLCVKDEAARLPYLLAYYRNLGIHWFFIVDNGSTDGTDAFIRDQPDCSLFVTHDSFAEAEHGMAWINALIERFGIGHWCLFVDADELFVYPHSETVPLSAFCGYLASRHYEGVYAFMLDMYSDRAIARTTYEAGIPFLDVCPLHDVGYSFRTRPQLPFGRPAFPPFEVVGGPRLRCFYPEFLHAGWLGYTLPRALAKLRRSGTGRALRLHHWLTNTTSPPLLSKVPLSFGRTGRGYLGNHKTTRLRLAPVTGVLLHFKFFSDFHDRVTSAVESRQHFDESSEYGRYAAALAADPCLRFAGPASVRYTSSQSLLDLRLLRTERDYEDFVVSHESQMVMAAQPADDGDLGIAGAGT